MQKTKNYNAAPLPFMGQKRGFLNAFKHHLKEYSNTATYVDLFGGSGLLSHTIKKNYPEAKVVYNDFDNYRKRLENINKTNVLVADIREILKFYPKDKAITGIYREQVLERLANEEQKGYVDYITLSSSILFSMKYALNFNQLQKETLYNTVRQTDYNADGYLDGLEIVTMDYKNLFEKYKNEKNVIFVADPPYLSTEVGTYQNHWKLKDYLAVLEVLHGTNFFYFTSNKSQIIELCEWIETKTPMSNPFNGAIRVETNNPTTSTSSYTDIMLHKKWTQNNT